MSAVATKSDLRKLKQELRHELRTLNHELRLEFRHDLKSLGQDMVKWKEELRLHFDVVAERMESAVRMFNVEVVKDHSQRLVRLETMMGIR